MSRDAPIEELKVRARVRLNQARREGQASASPLRAQLQRAAQEVGFAHWDQARQVLSGRASQDDDMGCFWHAPRTGILLHHWFARHDEASAVLTQLPSGFLLPYRRQCFIAQSPFIQALGVDAADPAWQALGHDLVRGYGTPAWQHLARQRVRAPLATFESRISLAHANTSHRTL